MFRRLPRVVIFGCGSAGRRAFASLRRRAEVIGFADNDPARQGATLFDRPVFAPAALRTLDCDRIVIGSMFHHEIRHQLVDVCGLDPAKVTLAPEFTLAGDVSGLAAWLRARGWPGGARDWDLWRLRNRHRGRRVFVIGNGPSLRMSDLDRLAERGELCLAANKIFLAFDRTRWRPDYYAVQDPDTPRQAGAQIAERITGAMFIAEHLKTWLPPAPRRVYFRAHEPPAPPARPEFSFNLLHGVMGGRTITYTLLQLAAWLGCREVFLLGVDFNYATGPVFDHTQHQGLQAYAYDAATQGNYFVPDYHQPGETILKPYLDYQRCAYEAAREQCHRAGRMPIRNATRGGNLEVFERVDFDSLF